jgi:hypothetical protein
VRVGKPTACVVGLLGTPKAFGTSSETKPVGGEFGVYTYISPVV